MKQRKMVLHSDLSKKLNIAYINTCTEAEGPYKRMAIWFQGCNVMCNGCCNPELQEIKPVHIMTIQEVLDIALHSKKNNGIEGVTFLGGEPTLQEGLSDLAKVLSQNGLGVILFTGKHLECLDESVINTMDLIIDGEFDIKQLDKERNLIGSKNQRIIYITERYKNMQNWFLIQREKRIEISLNDSLFINGDVI